MTDIWFTADLHFGHKNILSLHPRRPGAGWAADVSLELGVECMNDTLIQNWNEAVGRRDEVWVLGDFFMGKSSEVGGIFHRLNGSKHLIVGNHDHAPTRRLPWASVHDLYSWKRKPYSATLCHYPLLTWDRAHYGSWMLHGHSHGLLGPTSTTRMDVGVDCHPEFRPFHLDEIAAEMSTRSYAPVDAHR